MRLYILITLLIFVSIDVKCNTTRISDIDDELKELNVEDETTEKFPAIRLSSSAVLSEVDEDEDLEDTEYCDGRISTFVRNLNRTQFLPPDYEELEEAVSKGDIRNKIHHINDTIKIVERLVAYGQQLTTNKDLKDAILYFSSLITEKLYKVNISPSCMGDLVTVLSAIRNRKLWAMQFPDSFAHTVPTGLLRGQLSSFGEFDECIGIKSPPQENGRFIYGKYCQLHFASFFPKLKDYDASFERIIESHPQYGNLLWLAKQANADNYLAGMLKKLIEGTHALKYRLYHYGVCFPHTCTSADIQELFTTLLYPFTKIPMIVDEERCTQHKEITEVYLDNQQWLAVIVLAILAALAILSTLYDVYLRHFNSEIDSMILPLHRSNEEIKVSNSLEKNHSLNLSSNLSDPVELTCQTTVCQQFLLSFSIIQNTEKLVKVNNRYAIFDTFRFLLTFGVYSLQTFNFQAMLTMQMLKNVLYTTPMEILYSNAYWFARAPGYLIDGFVFIFGVMLVLSQFSQLHRSKNHFSFFIYLWKRWFRLSVALVGTFFVIFLFPLVGDGPMWFVNKQWFMPPCKETSSIISSFLFYSNWNSALKNYSVSPEFPICNLPTWFLSMSTQLYVLAPLVFLPLYRWPKIGLTITGLLLLISPLFTMSPTLILGHPTYLELTKLRTASEILRAFSNYHTNTFQYITPFSIGILTGYLIKRYPNLRPIGGRPVEIFLWIASFSTYVIFYTWHNSFWGLNQVNSTWNTLAWFALSKLATGFGLAYISYMCCTGKGGVVNRALTIRFLQPVAKLSYSIYLLRMPTIMYRVTTARHPYEMTYYKTLQNILIDYMITTVLAYFLYILFEAPSINLMKIFEGKKLDNKQIICQHNGSVEKGKEEFNNNNNDDTNGEIKAE